MPSRKRTFIILICICAILVSAMAASGRDGADLRDEPDNRAEQSAGPDLRAYGQEEAEDRTEFSKTFRKGGLTTVLVNSRPIHYKDRNSKWQDIDTTIEDAGGELDPDRRPYGHAVRKNSFETYFSRHGNGWIELRAGDCRLAFKLAGAAGRSVSRSGRNRMGAAGVMADCDISYEVEAGMIKEDIILKSPSAPRTFRYQLRLDGLSVAPNNDGEYVFSDAEGREVFIMPKPFMYDANNEYSGDIEVQLRKTGNRYEMEITPSRAWLEDSRRVYPVTLDPTYYKVDATGFYTNRGRNNLLYMYIPCDYPSPGSTIGKPPGGGGAKIGINNPMNMINTDRPYPIHAWYRVWVDDNGIYGIRSVPYFQVSTVDPTDPVDPVQTDERVGVLVREQFHDGTRTGEFDIPKYSGALVEMHTGSMKQILSSDHGFKCWFEITYQNDTMSPPPPAIAPLPPETYSTSVELNWGAVEDEDNTGNPSDEEHGNISRYMVQRSTDPTFTTDVTTEDAGNNTSYEFRELLTDVTHYFRVYAHDKEGNQNDGIQNPIGNPLPQYMDKPWHETDNPSGPRYSDIVSTRCVAPPPPGGPAKPAITDVTSGIGRLVNLLGNERFTSDRNPRIHWTGSAPVSVPFRVVTGGASHSVGLSGDGTVWAWGSNEYGQLGNGTFVDSLVPVQVKGPDGIGFLTDIISISCGFNHTVALKSDGTVWAWGHNIAGQLGDGTNDSTPVPIQVLGLDGIGFLTNVIEISAGGYHSVALKNDGTVWNWGEIANPIGCFLTPVVVSHLHDITAISAGSSHSLALKRDGTVWGWGDRLYGQLGDGTTYRTGTVSAVPVKGPGGQGFLTDISAISAGGAHSMALKYDGTVWSWGLNESGQLGNNTTTNSLYPVQVKSSSSTYLTGVNAIWLGGDHSMALRYDGSIVAWGGNDSGQLGDGSHISHPDKRLFIIFGPLSHN